MSLELLKKKLTIYKEEGLSSGYSLFGDADFNSKDWASFIEQNNILIHEIINNKTFNSHKMDLIDYIVGFLSFHDKLGRDFSPMNSTEFNRLKKIITESYNEFHALKNLTQFEIDNENLNNIDHFLKKENLRTKSGKYKDFSNLLSDTLNNLELLSKAVAIFNDQSSKKKRGFQYNSLNNKKAVFFFQKYYLLVKNATKIDDFTLRSNDIKNVEYNLTEKHYNKSNLKNIDDFQSFNIACELTANAMAVLKIAPSSIGGNKVTSIQVFEASLNPKIYIGRETVEYIKTIKKNGHMELLHDELNFWRYFKNSDERQQ